MSTRTFNFKLYQKTLTIELPLDISGYPEISGLRPISSVYIPSLGQSVEASQATTPEEFSNDVNSMLGYIMTNRKSENSIDTFVDALNYILQSHCQRCNRMFFCDLLSYHDAFAYILKALGYSETNIKQLYLSAVKRNATKLQQQGYLIVPQDGTALLYNAFMA